MLVHVEVADVGGRKPCDRLKSLVPGRSSFKEWTSMSMPCTILIFVLFRANRNYGLHCYMVDFLDNYIV